MTAQHTPGPWTYWPTCIGEGGRITQDGTALHIAAPTLYLKREQTEANARLIAAAPDLLEALRDLEAMAERYRQQGAPMPDAQKAARAAIAKATGKETQ